MNEGLFGDLDDKARASMRARGEIDGNSYLMRSTQAAGNTDDAYRLFEHKQSLYLDEERGRSLLEQHIVAPSTMDQVVDRVVAQFVHNLKQLGRDKTLKDIGDCLTGKTERPWYWKAWQIVTMPWNAMSAVLNINTNMETKRTL